MKLNKKMILWFPRQQFDIAKFHIQARAEFCDELEKQGYDVKIAITGENDFFNKFKREYISIPVIRKKYLRILSFWIFGYLKFIKEFLLNKPHIVILDIYSVWFSFPWCLLFRKPIYILDNRTPYYEQSSEKPNIRDYLTQIYTSVCYKYCRLFLNGLTVITDYYKQEVCRYFGFKSTKVGVWSSGIDLNIFNVRREKPSNLLDIPIDKFILLYHGEFSYNRGLLETVEAMRFVESENIIFVLIGDVVSGCKAKDDIKKIIKKYKIEDRVKLLPPVSHEDIPNYIASCNCAVMAYPKIEYWNKNNPLKLLEYLAMGKVVICTNSYVFTQVMGNKKCATYIDEPVPKNIAKAINFCYHNKDKLSFWGEEGIEIVTSRFTWKNQAANFLDFIEGLNLRNR